MVRRYVHSEPTSRLAIWARRVAGFAFLAALLAVIIVRSGLLEIQPALATFAGALAIAVVALLLALAAFAVIWMEGLAGMGAALSAMAISLALLAYPVLFEPVFTLQSQNSLWSAGFILLIALIAICAITMLRLPRRAAVHREQKSPSKLRWPVICRWIFISAIPSGLLVAVTAYISTDVAAAPLLWVIPLSLYLLTWVLVFQRQSLIPHRIALLLQPFAIAAIVALLFYSTWVPLFLNLGGHLLAFFIIALAGHGELARTRPPARQLTIFYLALSFGGMVGGLFAGLVAPYAFSWVAEYPILATLAVFCRPFAQNIWKPFDRWLWPLSPERWSYINSWFWPAAAAWTTT